MASKVQKMQITEDVHSTFFDQAADEMRRLTNGAAESIIADSVATNRQLANFLAESRRLVEDEAVMTIDAMTLAFDGKAEKLKTLSAVTERVSSEVAFMKSSLNTVETKTAEVKRLTSAINALSDSLTRFKALVEDGTLDKAAKAAAAIQ